MTKKVLHLPIPVPVSLNNAYTRGRGHGRRVLTQKGRAFKEAVQATARVFAAREGWEYPPGARLSFAMFVCFPTNRRHDLDNTIKLPLDALAEALGFDDSVVDEIRVQRLPSDKEGAGATIWLEVLDEQAA